MKEFIQGILVIGMFIFLMALVPIAGWIAENHFILGMIALYTPIAIWIRKELIEWLNS